MPLRDPLPARRSEGFSAASDLCSAAAACSSLPVRSAGRDSTAQAASPPPAAAFLPLPSSRQRRRPCHDSDDVPREAPPPSRCHRSVRVGVPRHRRRRGRRGRRRGGPAPASLDCTPLLFRVYKKFTGSLEKSWGGGGGGGLGKVVKSL